MTPDITNYAEYYLRRLVNSLEKSYDPDGASESALTRLTNKLVGDAQVLGEGELAELRDTQLDEPTLARFIIELADDIVASPKFADQELDINIVRALLYMQRADPRIDQRVRQYLSGRLLNDLSHQAVAALDANSGDGRAFEIIESFGKLMWTVDRAAMVFCIDQVEDLRFFDNAEERFQKAIRDLIQIANRVPTAIILISCLGDFYDQVRGVLAQSYIDRIEKAGPVALLENRTPDEARLIISKRLEHGGPGSGPSFPDASKFFGPQFFEEFGGLSTRRLLEHAQTRLKSNTADEVEESVATRRRRGRRKLHLDAGGCPGLRLRSGCRSALAGRRFPRPVGSFRQRVGGRDGLRRFRVAGCPVGRPWPGQGRMGQQHSPVVDEDQSRFRPAGARHHREAEDRLGAGRPHLHLQSADAGRRSQAPARQGAGIDAGQDLLHAACERFPAEPQKPDGAGIPQIPRGQAAAPSWFPSPSGSA